ncbi:MAG: glycosyltransferase [Anaerolineales bacterium]
MRIACIAAARVPSRTANSIQVMKVAQSMAELGHEVEVLLPGPTPNVAWEDVSRRYGLRIRFSIRWLAAHPVARRYDFAVRAVRAARSGQADLVYAWSVPAAALSARLGVATLLEMHAPPRGWGRFWFSWFLRAPGARRVTPITHALERMLAQEYAGWARGPGGPVLPMGVDFEAYANHPSPARARAELGLREGITAGYTGHLYPGRGTDLMFELAGRHPEFQFLWVGGEERAVAHWRKRQMDSAGMPNLQIIGFVDQDRLPAYQAASDVLLMPYEMRVGVSSGGDTAAFASPMKMMEYLAAGRAILASDLPAIREILHEKIARLVPPEDVAAWSHALRELGEDASQRESLGNAAREEAARHTWRERTLRALEGLP